MEEQKNQPETVGQAQAVHYQAQGPAPPPGYYGQQQQQQPYVVVQQPAAIVVAGPPKRTYYAHIVLACCTCWCCGILWGFAAFIVALIAGGMSGRDPATANILSYVSIGLSVFGILTGIVGITVAAYRIYVVFYEVVSSTNFTMLLQLNLTEAGMASRDQSRFGEKSLN